MGKCQWQVFKPPSQGSAPLLLSVSADSDSDVWAVGSGGPTTFFQIQHFDGSTWSLVPAPNLSQSANLVSIKARSSGDVWAVGSNPGGSLGMTALTAHWDGTSWTAVPNPAQSENSILLSVETIGRSDVWAAGFRDSSSTGIQPLIEHFDGNRWVVDDINNPRGQAMLQAIAGTSVSNLWAGGYGPAGSLIESRDRRTRSWISSPTTIETYIDGMSARSTNDVWAIGPPSIGGPIVQRWDGLAWNSVAYPRADNPNAVLYGSNATPRGHLVAGLIDGGSEITAFVDRYRKQWTDMKVIQVGKHNTQIEAVTSVPGSADVWVVGADGPSPNSHDDLAERYTCGSSAVQHNSAFERVRFWSRPRAQGTRQPLSPACVQRSLRSGRRLTARKIVAHLSGRPISAHPALCCRQVVRD